MMRSRNFAINREAWTLRTTGSWVGGSGRVGITTLHDESRYYPMEDQAIIEMVPGKEDEVVDRLGSALGIQGYGEVSSCSNNLGSIALVRVDAHWWGCAKRRTAR